MNKRPRRVRTRSPEQVVAILERAAVEGRFPHWVDGFAVLAALDASEWLLADRLSRSPYVDVTPLDRQLWSSANLEEPSGFVAVLASWQPDGHLREAAVDVLANRRGPVIASALAVRLLDHVPQVREAALRALRPRLSAETVELVLRVLVAAEDRYRGPRAIEAVLGALQDARELDDAMRVLLTTGNVRLRRWAFGRAYERGLLSAEQLLDAVERDPDQLLRRRSAEWLVQVATSAQLQRLLESRTPEARLVALAKIPDADLAEPTLRRMLADPSAAVRETARWRARRRRLDVDRLFREPLRSGELTAKQRVACIEGLVAFGDVGDLALVERALSAPEPAVRSAAVVAVAALAGDESLHVLRPLLLDPSPRVSASAGRALARLGAGPEQAEDAWRSPDPAHRRAAWRLSRRNGTWNRVEADLRATADRDAVLAALARDDLRNWLTGSAGANAGRAPQGRRSRLLALLGESQVDDSSRRLLTLQLRS